MGGPALKMVVLLTEADLDVLRGESGAFLTPAFELLMDDSDFLGGDWGFFLWDILDALTSRTIELLTQDKEFELHAKDVPVKRFLEFRRSGEVVSVRYVTEDDEGDTIEREIGVSVKSFALAARDLVEWYLATCRKLNPAYTESLDIREIERRLNLLRSEIQADALGA